MGNSSEILLTPMTALFGNPYEKSDEQIKIIIREMVAILDKFSDEVLQAVWDDLKLHHSGKSWPLLPEVYQKCLTEQGSQTKEPETPAITEAAFFESEAGQYALRQGFAHDLWMYVGDNGLMDLATAKELVAKSRESRKVTYAMIRKGGIASAIMTRSRKAMDECEKGLKDKWLRN